MFPFAPADLFSAQGLGQNFIDVVPSTHTIYVHLRRAPLDPFSNLTKDFKGTIGKLIADSKLIQHRKLLRLLLAADKRRR